MENQASKTVINDQSPSAIDKELHNMNEAMRLQGIRDVIGAEMLNTSAFARCLAPILVALDWFGAPRGLLVDLPQNGKFTELDLSNILKNQGFKCVKHRVNSEADIVGLPVGSVVYTEKECHVYLGCVEGKHYWHNGHTISQDRRATRNEQILSIHRDVDFVSIGSPQLGWLSKLYGLAHKEVMGVILMSLFINILALAVSLFTMSVYNNVIPSGSDGNLVTITFAVMLAIVGGWLLRLGRRNVLTKLGAWVGINIADVAIRKSLSLSPEITGRAGLNNNISKVRTLSNLRNFVSGANTVAFIDYPFVIIFLIVIAILGGWIVFVPVMGIIAFLVASKLFAKLLANRSIISNRANIQLQEEIVAASSRIRALQGISGYQTWLKRLAELSHQASQANKGSASTIALMQSVSHALGLITVLATMAVGVSLVLSGVMNAGGLIATMMLIWRITTPAQSYMMTSNSVSQAKSAIRQFQQLLNTAGELSNPQVFSPMDNLQATISADRVFYRYTSGTEPALNSVSFDVAQGEMVAVIGPNGSGKTTLLNCLAGLILPQNGRIFAGGRDIRQFDPSDYRGWIGYQFQSVELFPMTVREYLKLGHHNISDSEICDVLAALCGHDWWKIFGQKTAQDFLDITLIPSREDPSAIRIKTILGLTHAILSKPKILLLDDPFNEQDQLLEKSFLNYLKSLRGSTTVIIATHRADLIESADKVAILDAGNLVYFGPVNSKQSSESKS